MTRRLPGVSNWAVAAVLATLGACLAVIAWSTLELEDSNATRRRQLAELERLMAAPELASMGPLASLDGLYGHRLCRCDTGFGPTLRFHLDARGRP